MELQHNRKMIEGVLAELKAAPPDECFPAPARLARNAGQEPCFVVAGGKVPVRNWLASAMKLERPTPDHELIASCGKSACINPRHIMWSFQPTNVLEYIAERTHSVCPKVGKGRQRTREIHDIPDNEIAEIRWLLHNNYPANHVAEVYKAPVTSVLRIANGLRSQHVTPKPVDMSAPIHAYSIAPIRDLESLLSQDDIDLARKLRWDDGLSAVDVARTVRTTPAVVMAITSRHHRLRLRHWESDVSPSAPKLTDAQVIELRRRARQTARFPWTDTAKALGVSVGTVRKAIGGMAYRWLDEIEPPVFKALSPILRGGELARRGIIPA